MAKEGRITGSVPRPQLWIPDVDRDILKYPQLEVYTIGTTLAGEPLVLQTAQGPDSKSGARGRFTSRKT